jgi:hypothetical protein
LGIGLLDYNNLLGFNDLGLDLLLFVGFQIALFLGLRSHPLYRFHHVILLNQESVTQLGGPLDVVREPLDHVREPRQCLDARVPGLFRNRVRQRLILQIFVFR